MMMVLRQRGSFGMLLATRLLYLVLLCALPLQAEVPRGSSDASAWFEAFKEVASDEELYRFLYAMPKGGDLHNHLSGSILAEWFYELALAQSTRGYEYYTRIKINNCRPFGANRFSQSPYLLLFVNIQQSRFEALDECEQGEFVALRDLNEEQLAGWLDSMRLDKYYEGRSEFFETHWQRMGDLYLNPYLAADAVVKNMQAFGDEGATYLESMIGVMGFIGPDGEGIDPDAVADIYRQRLQQDDALNTGVTVKFQVAILRFLPNAEEHLRYLYAYVDRHSDIFVAVNMVGREDNDKGYPLRFLDTLRDLRRQHRDVRLSIHAGEVDEPNSHVRDTLLLGADRIGHGVNLISDPDTMLLMRNGAYMVEINLISNLLLEYVGDYRDHPFPEYLRVGIPVALSTDDRGMWDSNLTDEFFVAVKEFDVSWSELRLLSHNSLQYSFLDQSVKEDMLQRLDARYEDFERRIATRPAAALATGAKSYGFICTHYDLCDWNQAASTVTNLSEN